jgi:hypothetical protein
MLNNTTGWENTAIGINTLRENTTGTFNTALGSNSLYAGNGSNNTALGSNSMVSITSGGSNLAVGVNALFLNQSGGLNVAVGNNTLFQNLTANSNTAIGTQALQVTTASNNTAVGYQAGNVNTTGTNNTLLGNSANVNTASLNYATAIGSGATVACSNCLVLGGNTATNRTKVGINNSTPTYYLDLEYPSGVGNGFGIHNASAAFGWELYQFSTSNLNFIYNGVSVGNINSATGAYTATSDSRMKTSIRPMEPVLDRIMRLTPSRYEYIRNNPFGIQSIGFIAQDVEPLFPEFVSRQRADNDHPEFSEIYGLDYAGMSVLSIKAIQEQQKQIDELKKQNELLMKRLEQIENKK